MNRDREDSSGTVRGVAGRLLQLVATRIELLVFEFEEERRGAVELILLVAAGATLGLLAVVILTVAAILAFPAEWRAFAALIAGLLYAGVAAWLLLRVRRRIRDRPPPFAATVEELKRDHEWLTTLK